MKLFEHLIDEKIIIEKRKTIFSFQHHFVKSPDWQLLDCNRNFVLDVPFSNINDYYQMNAGGSPENNFKLLLDKMYTNPNACYQAWKVYLQCGDYYLQFRDEPDLIQQFDPERIFKPLILKYSRAHTTIEIEISVYEKDNPKPITSMFIIRDGNEINKFLELSRDIIFDQVGSFQIKNETDGTIFRMFNKANYTFQILNKHE